jgi:hypothetical protein
MSNNIIYAMVSNAIVILIARVDSAMIVLANARKCIQIEHVIWIDVKMREGMCAQEALANVEINVRVATASIRHALNI